MLWWAFWYLSFLFSLFIKVDSFRRFLQDIRILSWVALYGQGRIDDDCVLWFGFFTQVWFDNFAFMGVNFHFNKLYCLESSDFHACEAWTCLHWEHLHKWEKGGVDAYWFMLFFNFHGVFLVIYCFHFLSWGFRKFKWFW